MKILKGKKKLCRKILQKRKITNFSSYQMEICYSNRICQNSKSCHLVLKGKLLSRWEIGWFSGKCTCSCMSHYAFPFPLISRRLFYSYSSWILSPLQTYNLFNMRDDRTLLIIEAMISRWRYLRGLRRYFFFCRKLRTFFKSWLKE